MSIQNNLDTNDLNESKLIELPEKKKDCIELFKKFRENNDPLIREQLISENLDIVYPIAKKFWDSGESFEDIIQVGYIGLIKAVDNFDPERGVKFSTYATHSIMGEIRHHIRDKSESIKKPRWLNNLNREVATFIETFLQKHEKLPSIKEISNSLNISEEGVIEILQSRKVISFSELPAQGGEQKYSRSIRSLHYETFKLPVEDRIILEESIEKLKLLEKKIIYLFFYVDLNQNQVASKLGLSQKKVSRMLRKIIDKMRKTIFPGKNLPM